MLDTILSLPVEVHWDFEIVSIVFDVITIIIGLYLAIGLNRKIGIATRQKELLYKFIDQFSDHLNVLENEVRTGSIVSDKAISVPYTIQTKLVSLQRIVGNSYGKRASTFNSSATKLNTLLYSLVELLDSPNTDNLKTYSYDSTQIISIEKLFSGCFNLLLELQININKL